PSATAEEIKRSYKTLMSQYHPDKVATLGEEIRAVAERKSKDITRAYRYVMKSYGESS
ncbi:MAG: DnaJ domain-containing protein, partial [Armatimonadota bacterium]|nr:DnaJ domain-containing protein [Armatimonadota bacterium]